MGSKKLNQIAETLTSEESGNSNDGDSNEKLIIVPLIYKNYS
jgi:hypothetical protein